MADSEIAISFPNYEVLTFYEFKKDRLKENCASKENN